LRTTTRQKELIAAPEILVTPGVHDAVLLFPSIALWLPSTMSYK
jgi:hypothetical protein